MSKATMARSRARPNKEVAGSGNAQTDERVDGYIERAAPFARPILDHQRQLIHGACPGVEETIKWGRPTFVYRGRILCVMAAFRAHCALSFWQSEVAVLIARDGHGKAGDGAGQFGRITSLTDLPDDTTFRRYLAEAVRVLGAGRSSRPQPTGATRRTPIPVPADFSVLLHARPAAALAFEKFSPSHRREYLEWIVEAKRDETRIRRMATAIEWLAEGKARNWKHQ